MSGHSKWANIKHKKGAADLKRGKIFSRLTKEIIAAVKKGGGDHNSNTRLRNVLASARAVNMPSSNIERAIKKALGTDDGTNYEEICYEGYGSGGVAILVECLSDNRNRTAGEIRMLFDRGNGTLAGGGTVLWMFKKKARFLVTGKNADETKLMEIVLDAGAEDILVENGSAEILAEPDYFDSVSKALEKAGIKPDEAGIIQKPDNYVEVKDLATAKQALSLIEKLEEQDDVQAVYSNLDIPQEILAELEKRQ